jgi:hypothetical protein
MGKTNTKSIIDCFGTLNILSSGFFDGIVIDERSVTVYFKPEKHEIPEKKFTPKPFRVFRVVRVKKVKTK